MTKKILYIYILVFVSFVFADNESNIFSEYNAQPDANRVLISWITKDESNIKYFTLKRSNDNNATFISIAQVNKKGPGFTYQYFDENVFFKSSNVIYYKIDAVNKDGNVIESTSDMAVRPDISGIFRTWGAIKAMFR